MAGKSLVRIADPQPSNPQLVEGLCVHADQLNVGVYTCEGKFYWRWRSDDGPYHVPFKTANAALNDWNEMG